MERYDYKQAMYDDIQCWMKDNIEEIIEKYDEPDDNTMREDIYDILWMSDSVTGNASGSYTFNTWAAEENICHNWDLLLEAFDEFGGCPDNVMEKGAEYCDVTIRCYILGEILDDYLESDEFLELWNEHKVEEDDTEGQE